MRCIIHTIIDLRSFRAFDARSRCWLRGVFRMLQGDAQLDKGSPEILISLKTRLRKDMDDGEYLHSLSLPFAFSTLVLSPARHGGDENKSPFAGAMQCRLFCSL